MSIPVIPGVRCSLMCEPGRVAQSIGRLTQEPEVPVRHPVRPHTFVSPSADLRRKVVSYWRKYVNEVLVNYLGGLSLPRKSVVNQLLQLCTARTAWSDS